MLWSKDKGELTAKAANGTDESQIGKGQRWR